MKIEYFLTFLLLTNLITSCGSVLPLDPSVVSNTDLKKAAFREVKLIRSDITDSQNPETLKSSTYHIGPNSRLLLRFSELQNVDPEIINLYPVVIKVSLSGPSSQESQKALSLCPISKNWMMLATWQYAHPYKYGNWESDGGDIFSEMCVGILSPSELDKLNAEEKTQCNENSLCFDIRPLLENLYRINKLNYGFILINNHQEGLMIHGDNSVLQPLILWRRLK